MQSSANGSVETSSDAILFYVNSFVSQLLYYVQCIEENRSILLLILTTYIVVCLFSYFIFSKISRSSNYTFESKEKILFLISHPDDECMFFGPAIVNLAKQNKKKIFLLCLSYGDYYEQGKLRKEELWKSCSVLGIPESNIFLQRITLLPDDPSVSWNESVIFNLVINYVETFGFDVVITFDNYGVSGHLNHKSVYYALARSVANKHFPKYCAVYCLDSVNKLRKYSFILDLVISICFSSNWFILSPSDCYLVKKALKFHHSQYVWYRKLYIWISRYAYINTFSLLRIDEAAFDVDFREVIE